MNLSAIVFFAVLANLDNLIIGLSYGVKGISITSASYFIIASISFIGTALSMCFGKSIAYLMPVEVANIIGGVILMGIGAAGLIKCYRGKNACPGEETQWPVQHPEKYDKNQDKRIAYNETALLGVALAVNNMGLGVGASLSGLVVFPAAIAVFFASIFLMLAGNLLGSRILCGMTGKRAELISAVCVIFLGIWEILT